MLFCFKCSEFILHVFSRFWMQVSKLLSSQNDGFCIVLENVVNRGGVLHDASRTHLEVFDLEGQVLGLEASRPRKLPCPLLVDSTISWIVKILQITWKIYLKTFFLEISWKKILKTFFFRRTLVPVSLFHGLEHSCPWPREGLSSEGLSLASDFLCPWPWPRALCPRLHIWLSNFGFQKLNWLQY